MTSYLLYHPFALLILCIFTFIPTSSQRTLQIPSQYKKDYYRSNDGATEIPIISAGAGSSEIHLVRVMIGEPPQTRFLIPDTGSDASWVYCDCEPYYRTDHDKPNYRIFDYSLSNTFTPLTRNYTHEYVDGTSTAGFWARETVTLRSSEGLDFKFKNVMIGCSSPAFTNLTDGDGILGLSPNHPSFVAHIAPKFGSIFSYSLSNNNKAKLGQNLLVFGKHGGSSFDRNRMQYTELVRADSFFSVEVSCLFIDDKLLEIPRNAWKYDDQNDTGGVILDTGTTFTYVPEFAFHAIHEFYAEFFQTYNSVEITDSDVCYNFLACEFDGVRVPEMAIEFEGGARFVPNRENLFYENGDGAKCLGIRPIGASDGSIIGNNLQKGYFWEYDLLYQRVGFAPLSTQMATW